MEEKILVEKDDLVEFRRLFKTCAGLLEEYGEESLAIECEQTAEMIEGYYLPYPVDQAVLRKALSLIP